jgi:hypothetical protein
MTIDAKQTTPAACLSVYEIRNSRTGYVNPGAAAFTCNYYSRFDPSQWRDKNTQLSQ